MLFLPGSDPGTSLADIRRQIASGSRGGSGSRGAGSLKLALTTVVGGGQAGSTDDGNGYHSKHALVVCSNKEEATVSVIQPIREVSNNITDA